jgi:aryl-alcohol dehydrogenase-like predicted oxidoreductase
MDYVKLGSTGLEVSKLCLGCMSYGDPERGGHPWALPEDQSAPFLLKALDAGVNFFDTANVYSNGSSEEILGSVLLKKRLLCRLIRSADYAGGLGGTCGGRDVRRSLFRSSATVGS